MKKLLMLAAFAAISAGANAADIHQPPQGGRGMGGPDGGGFMVQLTDEQKSCIEQQGCPKREIKKQDGGLKNGEKPQISEEDKAAMESERECQKKAFDACGIQMPERPEGMPQGGPGGGQGIRPRG